ncbi:hypothetical protein MPTK1_8g03210 [Marchantia polymorpha subsp. ruderalis]|uniref:RING-type E3 ubiquitin transferase n=1 Tax=Marchantia polymorpha TaxID=3197 RepID=A0A2R6XJB6_MARPO|nr:hypothetical protein MARPO_0012s0113 [Marchantia polymorpha]BBN18529.1 hypothetical protein Mp_8g03210 [Marchantia polymorpha subsp. ruderalis]|eukprot:PTQ46172.1 hypothetical protein MARPO_0012s0113 [Marchantia polymorpha]
MADVLEAMGFPSDWCERALSSASGIETAVDLLLQWQAQGTPHFLPPSPSLSGANVQLQGGPSPSRPTLRLVPIPASDPKVVGNEADPSPSSTLQPSTSSSSPSSLDGPSDVQESTMSKSPTPPFPRNGANAPVMVHNSVARGRNGAALQEPLDRVTTTSSISCVDDTRPGSARGAGTSRNSANSESTDAVVPDAFAEERKSRYAAAQRAKQEKEAEKAKIRQQLQEDMAHRRFRHTMMAPTDNVRSGLNLGKQPFGQSTPAGSAVDPAVPTQLQIRCPGNQIIKGMFNAVTTLKEVRAYVESQLQRPPTSLDSQEESGAFRQGHVAFSGQSSRLSADRQAERVLLQAARENFEYQTSRILASAKTLRNNTMAPDPMDNQSRGTMYFLIPIPRQEYFTESAMESTLAQAQLVPRGTLVVQFRNSDTEQTNIFQVQAKDSSTDVEESNKADNRVGPSRSSDDCQNCTEAVQPDVIGPESPDSKSVDNQVKAPSQAKRISLSFDRGLNGASNSGRNSLDVDGERVRVRELALQAAAKRMSEAAKIFRDGLPLGEGETGGAFPFPVDGDNPYSFLSPIQNGFSPPQQCARAAPADDLNLNNLRSAGADAELLDASPPLKERSSAPPGSDKLPHDRPLDALHRQTMAAAEARLRTSQCQPNLVGCSYEQEPEEAESRIGVEDSDSIPPRGRARVPLSSRLLSRPEKLQRTSGSSPSSSPASCDVYKNSEELPGGSAKPHSQLAGPSCTGPFEAALERFNAHSERNAKGKGPVQDEESSQVAAPPTSHQTQAERQSSLRVRLEDGRVQTLSFPANTLLQTVRDSVVPEGAEVSAYGFFIPIPGSHIVEGEELGATLEEAGLVPRGIVHLIKMSTRGMVRQGRRTHRRRRYVPDIDDEVYNVVGMFRQLADYPHERQDLTYEELMELEESIGRVHVGVPEEVIAALPVHTVKGKKAEETTEGVDNEEGVDVCVVCIAEIMNGEEALTLPCVHTFHPLCIRRWLQQSTCCPTCKHCLI